MKCSTCKKEKISEEFYKSKNTNTGLSNTCKKCHTIYNTKPENRERHKIYQRKWSVSNSEKCKAYREKYRSKPKIKERMNEYQKKWRALNPEKNKEYVKKYREKIRNK